jgi:hypothetical protein
LRNPSGGYATSTWPTKRRAGAVAVRLHSLIAVAARRGCAPTAELEWARALLLRYDISPDVIAEHPALCAEWRRRNAPHQV